MLAVGTVSAETVKLYATFGTPASSASYSGTTYTWSANNNNLMTVFEFSNGELAKYSTLKFTIGSPTGGMVRMGYYVGETFTEFGSGFGSDGTKTVDLTALSIDRSKVTKIAFGGRTFNEGSSSGSCTIDANSVYLEGTATVAGNSLTATFGTLGSNAKLVNYYSCTETTDNLVTCYTFDSGQLANYTNLKFDLSKFSSVNIRINVLYKNGDSEDNADFGGQGYSSGYWASDGSKSLTTETILSGIKSKSNNNDLTLAAVKAIRFGGTNNSGSVYLTNMKLTGTSVEDLAPTFNKMGSKCTFKESYYVWTGNTNNLMDVFTFSNGELANYTTLTFTFSDLSDGSGIRMGYYVGSEWTEFGNNGYYSAGTKTVDLLALGIDLSKVTKISFGGKSNEGNCVIKAEDVVLSNATLITGLTRQFTIDRKSTVCLPFDLTETEATAAGKFYTLNSVDGTTLKFTEVADPDAYTPYVFVPATEYPFAFLNKSIASSVGKTCKTVVGNYTFQGVMVAGKVPQGAYGYNAETGAFSQTTSGNVDIDACRAYITGPAAARLNVIFDDESTGIETLNRETMTVNQAYNLQGQRVSEGHKGLVIKNGKKMIVK